MVQGPVQLPVPAPVEAAVPLRAWVGEVVAGQGLAAGPDRVQHVALGPVAAPGPRGPVDLDHPLALVDQKPGQPGPRAARPLQRPDPPARGMGQGQLEQPGMAGPVAWHLQGGPHPPLGSSTAAAWQSRWVSTPMTASTWPSSIGIAVAPSKTATVAGTGLVGNHHAAAGL